MAHLKKYRSTSWRGFKLLQETLVSVNMLSVSPTVFLQDLVQLASL